MTTRYSALKAMKYPDRLAAIRDGGVAGPVHVQIILSDLCNQNCAFCAFRDPGYTSSQLFHEEGNYNPNRMLPYEKVIEILDDCVDLGVKAVQYTGGGEPTIHPQFDDVIAATLERGLQWAVVTNGVRSRDLSTATWIRVSLDAGRRETYAKIRQCPPRHFDKACATIDRHRPGVGFVVTPDNWREVVEATRLVKSLGASNIRIGAQFSGDGIDLHAPYRAEAAALVREAVSLADDRFEVTDRFSEKMDDLAQGRPEYKRCGYQHFTTYIGADQNLYRCCVYAYNPRGLLGSIKDRRLKDVWREIAYPDFRSFDARGCERCQFNRINRGINEVLEPDLSEAFV